MICSINELIKACKDFASYIRKFPQILMPLDEIEHLIDINTKGQNHDKENF